MDGTGQTRRSGGKQAGRRTVPRVLATTKAPARRLAPETAQEKRSKGQFIERLGEVEWNEFRPETDLGEDFAVQIHDGGASTGLSFYVQLKSIQDAQRYRPKRGAEELRYRLEVKDVERWEVQTTPVVLVVWDVRARRGYWQMIPKIVADLDRGKQGWREKKTVTVSVPMDQGTDDAGLRQLRWAVADHQEPLVPKIGEGEISFYFPPTQEGDAAAKALRDAINLGEGAIVDGSFITSVRFPEWHERLYGPADKPLHVELKPNTSERTIPIRIELHTDEGQFALPYIELRASKIGRKRIELTSDGLSSPLQIALTVEQLEHEGHRWSYSIEQVGHGRTVAEEKDAIGFLLAHKHHGGRLRLIDLRTGDVLVRFPKANCSASDDVTERLRRYHELLDKLSFIQSRTTKCDLAIRGDLTHADVDKIEALFRILRDGRATETASIDLTIGTSGTTNHAIGTDRYPSIVFYRDAEPVELLGTQVPLGKVRITIKDAARLAEEHDKSLHHTIVTGKPTRVTVDNIQIVAEYLDWLPSNTSRDQLYEVASGQAGYFSLGQALAAGYSSADILEAEERVERLAGDVFRLVQFPRSEHEDLLVLWLRSKQKGVFSHDTALSLHGLSDVLPSRLHLTLPPGHHPPDGSLGDGVDVHHAPIEDTDITWFGPIPVTKPLRTLRDCIEDHLSPDLLDQALDDAFQRGLIAEADLEALQAARAKSA